MSIERDACHESPDEETLPTLEEPPPYDILNPHSDSPVVLIADHAGRHIPRDLGNLGLDEAMLARHIAWDIGIADVTRHMAQRLRATAILSGFSRLVIDPNRHLNTPSSIPAESDGITVPGNQNLSAEDRALRAAMYFRPYHGAIEKAIEERLLRGKRPVLVSMHSFTPVMNSVERPWKIGILWNEDSRLPKPLIARLRAMGLPVGDNQPYSGRYGYSQHVHGDDRGLASALIELRQDLIDTHHGAEEWGELLAGVLQEILGDPELYLPFKPRQSG